MNHLQLPERRIDLDLSATVGLGTEVGFLEFEETASFWLFLWPDLLGWPRNITWLFSPVTGKTRYPGDLWGIDETGHLVVVETKLFQRATAPDPFEDFVAYERN